MGQVRGLGERLQNLIGGLRGEDEKRNQYDFVTAGVFAPGDPLTGVPNRRLLVDRLHQALARAADAVHLVAAGLSLRMK